MCEPRQTDNERSSGIESPAELQERLRRLQLSQRAEEQAASLAPAASGSAATGQRKRGKEPLWRAYHNRGTDFAKPQGLRVRSRHAWVAKYASVSGG
jgi:hypothetical protein